MTSETEPIKEITKEHCGYGKRKEKKKRCVCGEWERAEFQEMHLRQIRELINRTGLDGDESFQTRAGERFDVTQSGQRVLTMRLTSSMTGSFCGVDAETKAGVKEVVARYRNVLGKRSSKSVRNYCVFL